jgi:glycerol-3-phosphate acyltransferase PlsY
VGRRGRWAAIPAAFALGSIPTANLFARRRGVDLREIEEGTVSGTGLYRVAGFGPLVTAGLLDIGKGALAVRLTRRGPLRPLATAAVIAGHNWSPWLRGAGGRGVSPALGALAVQDPAGVAVLFAGLGAGRLARHTGLGTAVALVMLVPVLARRSGIALALAVVVPIFAKRILGNRPPDAWSPRVVASRALFDHDP